MDLQSRMVNFLKRALSSTIVVLLVLMPFFSSVLVKQGDVAHAATQDGYRWRNDDGSEAAATFADVEDTSLSATRDVGKRLRFDVTGSAEDSALIRTAQTNITNQVLQSNTFAASVIDATAGFAYFATATTPARIVKVKLSNFTEVGTALTLNFGEDNVRAAVIDTTGGFAYFATGSSPAKIVKVNLSTFTRVGVITLSAGEDDIRSAVIDVTGGFAYFGTNTSPGVVVKVNLSTFTRTGALTLSGGENILTAAVVDTTGGFAYFGTSTSPGIVVKVQLSDFTRVGAVTLESGENTLTSAVIDVTGGFAYFGTTTTAGRVVKMQLSDFTRVGAVTLNAGENSLISAVIDTTGGFAYFGTSTTAGRVVKIQLSDFTRVGAVTLVTGENTLATAVMHVAGGYMYFGTSTIPARVVRLQLSDFTRSLGLRLGGVMPIDTILEGSIVGSTLYLVTADPGNNIVKYDLSTSTVVERMTTDTGELNPSTFLVDDANEFAYVSLDTFLTTASEIIKISLATFSRVSSITLNPSEQRVGFPVLDSTNDIAYFTDFGSDPMVVVKINLATFTRVGALALDVADSTGSLIENGIYDGFLYAATTGGGTARVVKINLTTFTRTGSVSLGVTAPSVGIADLTDGVLYVATATDFVEAAVVHKITLSSFTVTDTLTLNNDHVYAVYFFLDTEHNFLYTPVIDGAFTSGELERIDLESFTVATQSAFASGVTDSVFFGIVDNELLFSQYDADEVFVGAMQVHDPRQFRLEYGVKETTCGAIATWTQVPSSGTAESWVMSASENITNGAATTNLAGLTNTGTSFVAGQIMDTASETDAIELVRTTEFTEIEYSIAPTSSATTASYCFRLTDAGSATGFTFSTYAEASVASAGGGSGGNPCAVDSIEVVSPNGGEKFIVGQTVVLSWNYRSCRAGTVSVYLSSDGGVSFPYVIADSRSAVQNVFSWLPPSDVLVGDAMRMKVVLYDGSGALLASDLSNADFSLQVSSAPGAVSPIPAPPNIIVPPPLLSIDETGLVGMFVPTRVSEAVPTIAIDLGLLPGVVPEEMLLCPGGALIKLPNDNNSATSADTAVYYCGYDGKRYVFPNQAVFTTWFADFSQVFEISLETLQRIPLGGNITPRPGIRMVKIVSDPKVYAIARGGVLRAVGSEAQAELLYGADWAKYVDDVSDAFFVNYTLGTPL